MKKMKKLISLAVAFCVAASMLCTVYADDSTIVWNDVPAANGNTAYKWAIDGTTLYLHYDKPGTDEKNWVVVEEYDGADDTKVDHYTKRPWQASASTITDVVITGDAAKIGRKTFYSMPVLERVSLSGGITTIDKNAFCDCVKLGPSFVVPASVITIGEDAFRNTGIVSLIFEETTKSTKIYNLKYLSKLRNIVLRRPITTVKTSVYDFCGQYNSISGMTNPAKVNVLVTDESYFTPLANLTAYDKTYTVTAGNEMNLEVGTFDECTVIDKGQNVTFVNDVADKLSHLLYTENGGELTVEFLAHIAQDGANIIPDKQVHTALAADKDNIKKFVFSTGFTSTGNRFGMDGTSSTTPRYPNVKEVVLPITLLHIGDYAFYNMTKLSKVNFEDTLLTTGIGTSAFQHAPIETIILPPTLKAVYNFVFADNPALDTVYLPVNNSTIVRAYSFGATTASTGSTAYAGKNVKVILDGVYTLGESGTNTFNKNVFQDQNSVVSNYRTTKLIYDSSEWATAPSLLDATAVADKYYDVHDSDNDGKANLFMYSFNTAQAYKLFAGTYDGNTLSSAKMLAEGTAASGTLLNAEYDVTVDSGKTAKVFLWDSLTNIKPLDDYLSVN